jgi:hypothetical protein
MGRISRVVEFETAKLARDKGYHYGSYQAYSVWRDKIRKNDICPLHGYEIDPEPMGYGSFSEIRVFHNSKQDIVAPEQADLQKWLREEHKINVESNYKPNIGKYSSLYIPMDIIPKSFKSYKDYHNGTSEYISTINCDKYEDALEIGLIEALKLIK